jgi:hypothetical protein
MKNPAKRKTFPKVGGETVSVRNIIVKDGVEISIQFYVVSTYAKSGFWIESDARTLRSHSEPHFKG